MHRGGKQNQTAGEPQGRKFQKQEFRASRKKNTKTRAAVISAPLEMVQWSKPPSGDVKRQDKTHQT